MGGSGTPARMRIMHVHCRFDPFGGGERYLHGLCTAQAAAGHRVTVLTDAASPPHEMAGVEVRRVAASSGLRSGLKARRAVLEALAEAAPDVVHLHETYRFLSPLVLRALLRRHASVKTVHDAGLVCFHDEVGRTKLFRGGVCRRPMTAACVAAGCFGASPGRLREMALRTWELRAARAVGRIVVNSAFMREELERNRCDPARIRTIPPWTDIEAAADAPPPGEARLLFVGRLDRGKGIAHFLGALSLLRGDGWRAEVVGDGPLMDGARRIVARLGLAERTTFHGALPRDRLVPLLRAGRLLCMPSVVPETFGIVGIEAMACARPVVAYDAGGIAEWLVDGETGFLVPHGDVPALAARLRLLIEDAALAARLGGNARRRVDALYRGPRFFAAIARVYDEAIEDFARSGARCA